VGRATRLPVLVQKANHACPARFNVTGFVLLASLRDLACVVIPSDGNDSAETPALSIKSFFYKAFRSTLRNLPFYNVILYVFSKLLKSCRGKAFEQIIEGWRWGWRGRGWHRFA
jgi:hypothetical protein